MLDAMMPFLVEQYGNPHSRTHLYGWQSEEAVEVARKRVAELIGADPKEIIFTSVRRAPSGRSAPGFVAPLLDAPPHQGATESNNMAIKGIAQFYRDRKKHVITSQTDHKCVLDSCRHLQQAGWDVTYLPVKPDGLVDLQLLKVCKAPQQLARARTALTHTRAARTRSATTPRSSPSWPSTMRLASSSRWRRLARCAAAGVSSSTPMLRRRWGRCLWT